MKKLGKILALVISLVLIVSAIVLVASAEEEITTPYIIDGVAYGTETTTLADAITYANGKLIKLNSDVTISANVGISKDTHIDLNGHTITDTREPVLANTVFGTSATDKTITIEGEGKIISSGAYLIRNYSTAKNATWNLNGYGSGIVIETRYDATADSTYLIDMQAGNNLNISGNLIIKPAKFFYYIISAGKAKSTEKTNINIKGANITVEPPKNAENYRWDANSKSAMAPYFAYIRDGAVVNIDSSVIDMQHGNAFYFDGGSLISVNASQSGANKGQVTSRADGVAKPTLTQFITANNSTIAARCSSYSSAYAYRAAGILFSINLAPVEIRLNNTDLIGSTRSIAGTQKRDFENATAAKLYFTNVNYSQGDYLVDPYPYPFMDKLNIQWVGGKIDITHWKATSSITISGMADAAPDPFGANVKAYKIAESGATDEVAKEAAWKAFVDQYKDSDASDGIICAVTSKAVTGGYDYTYYIMEKGKGGDSLGNSAFKYSKLDDGDWYGILFKDVYFVKLPKDSMNDPSNTGGLTFAFEGTKYTNVYAPYDSVTKYAAAFLSKAPATGDAAKYDPYTNIYNPTTEWYAWPDGNKTSDSIPMNPNSIALSTNKDYGTSALVVGKNGMNGYYKFSVAEGEDNSAASDPYIETKLGTSTRKIENYTVSCENGELSVSATKDNTCSLEKYKYVIHEFDIASDDAFMGFYFGLVSRYATMQAEGSSGAYTYKMNNIGAMNHATVRVTVDSASGNLTMGGTTSGKASTMPSLAADGSWSRFTFVFEVGEWEEKGTYTLGDLTRTKEHLNVKLHIYLNGEWVASYDQIFKSGAEVDSALKDSVYIDAFRFQPECKAGTSLLLDNIRTTYYKTTTEGYSDVASAMATPTASIANKAEFLTMPKNAIGTVDGVEYYTESSLTSAMTNGCHVELLQNLRSPLNVNCAFTLNTNGFSVPAVYSTTHRIFRGEGTIASRAAYDCEIIKVNFKNSDFIISESVNAAIGSDVNMPESVKPEKNPTVFKTEGSSVSYLNIAGWSILDDGKADYPITLPSDIIYTKNGDKFEISPIALVSRGEAASYVFLDTLGRPATQKIYAVPGEDVYPKLPSDFKIEDYVDKSGWYEVAFISWDNALATKISESKNYELMPNVETRIPNGGIPGVKLNLSLYTDYELNVYIPKIESETVSNIKFTSDAEFTVPVDCRGDVTIYGDLYTKYFDRYGTADVNINSYYLSFEANGETLVQEIKYGIPSYAATVMSMTDTAIGVPSKSLVMNMVNYAVKVLELADADMTTGGAYYYKKMLKKFGDSEYLDAYNKLERDDFLNPESTVYQEQIANLTYKSNSYIKGASFLFSTEAPVFVFEYSDAAKVLGIGAPKNLFCDPTSGGVYALFGYGNENKNPVRHLAYNGGIYEGSDVTNTDVWGANTNSGISYYAYGDSYRYVDAASGGYHSAYNLLSPVTIDVMEGNTTLASGTYSLAAYINAIMTNNETEYVDAACALYAYALASKDFQENGSGVLPDEAIYTKKQSVLLIGQSNMVGSNDLTVVEPIEDDRITMLRDDKWVKMKEPLHTNSSMAGAGIGASFAKAFVETFDCEIGLIPAAEGGTNLNTSGNTDPNITWAVGSRLYNEAIRLAKIAQQDSEICAILWHQGEGDQNGTTYAEKLKPIFDAMIEELGLDPEKIIIITGELAKHRSDAVHRPQLELLSKHYANFGIASSEGLTTRDAQTHFDAPSMRVFGYRYFDIFYNFVTGKHYEFVDDPLYYLRPADTLSGNVISDMNFDELATGKANSVSGVVNYAPQTGSITVVEDTETEKYLKLETALKEGSTTDYCTPFFDVYCKEVLAGSVIVLEAQIKLDNMTDKASFDLFKIIGPNNDGVYSALQIGEDGKIYNVVYNGKKITTEDLNHSLDYLEWMPVRVVIDITANTKDVYLNNQLVVQGAKFIDEARTTVFDPNHVRVVQFNSSKNKGAICVDDYKLTVIPFLQEDFNELETGASGKVVGSLVAANLNDVSYITVKEKNVGDNYVSITSTLASTTESRTFLDLNVTGTEKISAVKKFVVSADVMITEGSTLDLNWFMPLIKYADVDENGIQKTDENGDLLWKTSPGILACRIKGNVIYNAFDSSMKTELFTFNYGDWYNIKLVIDLEANTKVFYVKDKAITEALPVYTSSKYPEISIRGLRIAHLNGYGTGEISFDNIEVYYN